MSEFNTKTYTRNISSIAISYMVQRVLTPKHEVAEKINDMIIDNYPGKQHHLLSFDEVEGDTHNIPTRVLVLHCYRWLATPYFKA